MLYVYFFKTIVSYTVPHIGANIIFTKSQTTEVSQTTALTPLAQLHFNP